MLSAVAFVPSPPLLSPALAGSATDELDELRSAVRRVCDTLADSSSTWIAIGPGTSTHEVDSAMVGSYAGFGADVEVRLSPAPQGTDASEGTADRSVELTILTVGLVREGSAPTLSVPVQVIARDTAPDECVALADELRRRVDSTTDRVGVLVVGDGATTLTDKAPGSFDARAEATQQSIDDAIAKGDVAVLAALDPTLCAELGIDGRVAWQVAAALVGAHPVAPTSEYRGWPYGVGYHAAVWTL